MKKSLFIFVIFIGCTISHAQFQFGIKAGAQITTLRFDQYGTEASAKTGYYLGGYANYRVSDDFAVQPELLYSLQGAEFQYSATHNPYFEIGKIELHYINLPLMVKWYVYNGLNLEFGPQFGLNVSGKQKGTIWTYDYETEIEQSQPFEYKIEKNQVDFGVNVGMGYEMKIGVNLGVRYHYGLQKVGDREPGKNSVFSFGAGYSF